jgi:AraC family transcriptional regulator of adaptative response/methylated-DNA-[protein]-cysteine methyltransferase
MEKQTHDYDLVKHTLAHFRKLARATSLETLADQAGLSPTHLQRLFTLGGIEPKAFLQAVTLDHARGLLRDSASFWMPLMNSGFRARAACMISL